MVCIKLFTITLAAICCYAQAQTKVPLLKRKVVHEFINTEYAGIVNVGVQPLLLVFDTSSDNIVVSGDSCLSDACNCAQRYSGGSNTKMGPSKSGASFKIFDFYPVTGTEASDTVKIETLTANNQGIVLATSLPDQVCLLRADGVVGMGRPKSGKAAFNQPTLIETLDTSGQIAGVFSFHHARLPDGEHFGELIIGGYDPKYITGEITYVPLVDSTSWNFKLDSITIDNTAVVASSLGMIDSSKNIVIGPAEGINKINAKLGCKNAEVHGTQICQFDCNNLPNIDVTFVIGGRPLNISSDYHIQQNGNVCFSGFMSQPESPIFLIGDFFIDHYVPMFDADKNRMGFAASVESL